MKSCATCTKPVPNNGGHDVADLKICHRCYVKVDVAIWEKYKKQMTRQKAKALMTFLMRIISRKVI